MGSRLAPDRSERSPKATEPPDFGGPETFCWPEEPPPQAAITTSAAVTRMPSTRLRIALLPFKPLPSGPLVATAYTDHALSTEYFLSRPSGGQNPVKPAGGAYCRSARPRGATREAVEPAPPPEPPAASGSA